MTTTPRISRRSITRTTTAAALTITAAFALTACGGSSADGVYLGEAELGNYAVVSIEGDEIRVHSIRCEDPDIAFEDSDTASIGILDDELTRVTWDESGEIAPEGNVYYFTGSDPEGGRSSISVGEGIVTLGDYTYTLLDSDEGELIQQNFEDSCN